MSAIRARVSAGMPVGILGYLDGEPIAWGSVVPKTTFERLGELSEDAVALAQD